MSITSQTTYRSVDDVFKSVESKIPAVGAFDVLVKITHCSFCGTDLDYSFGIALRHEGIGIITEFGSGVTSSKSVIVLEAVTIEAPAGTADVI